MDRDMDMTSDTGIRNKLNSCEEDEKTADIPRRKRKRTNNRASNAENILALMRESEKKRVEEKKLKETKKQQRHDEKNNCPARFGKHSEKIGSTSDCTTAFETIQKGKRQVHFKQNFDLS